ncbi:hypothetical protein D9M71_766830 [compost metagenome]
MERISGVRRQRSLYRTRSYLRQVLPPDLKDMPESDLVRIVENSRNTGVELGVKSLGGHQRWAYLMTITEGRVAQSPEAIDFIRSRDGTPDQQLKIMMQETLKALKAAAQEMSA